jgi:hypothetical protein
LPNALAMSDDSIQWLMKWYIAECNGDWEHSYGVEIGTLDNPGWSLKIDLRETTLADRSFTKVQNGVPADDLDEWQSTGSWWVAEVKDSKFEAACGPLDLPAIIAVFRNWVETALQS